MMLWQKNKCQWTHKTQLNNLLMPAYFYAEKMGKLNEYSGGLHMYTRDYYFLLNVN